MHGAAGPREAGSWAGGARSAGRGGGGRPGGRPARGGFMVRWRAIGRRGAAVALGVLLLGTGAASSVAASTAPAGDAPAQYYGGWGGWPGGGGWGGVTYVSPDWSSPYAGSA